VSQDTRAERATCHTATSPPLKQHTLSSSNTYTYDVNQIINQIINQMIYQISKPLRSVSEWRK
jgi:hypothetical protein